MGGFSVGMTKEVWLLLAWRIKKTDKELAEAGNFPVDLEH